RTERGSITHARGPSWIKAAADRTAPALQSKPCVAGEQWAALRRIFVSVPEPAARARGRLLPALARAAGSHLMHRRSRFARTRCRRRFFIPPRCPCRHEAASAREQHREREVRKGFLGADRIASPVRLICLRRIIGFILVRGRTDYRFFAQCIRDAAEHWWGRHVSQ